MSERNRHYILLMVLCTLGYVWLFLSLFFKGNGLWKGCLTKQILHIPCPSCGTTRSIIALWHGNILEAVVLNPFGLVVSALMIIVPVWIVFDVIGNSDSFMRSYRCMEAIVRRRWIAVTLVVLVVFNWVWNFFKY